MGKIYNQKSHSQKRRFLRHHATRAERILWKQLKSKQMHGAKFRRQFGVGPYVLDFYCPKFKLAIEVDGYSHDSLEARQYDTKRQSSIEEYGIRFIRFTNDEVLSRIELVVEKIAERIQAESQSATGIP